MWKPATAVLMALCVSGLATAVGQAQSAPNLAPPPFLAPSTTGAQIGSFDPDVPNNPNWLKPAGTVAPPAGVSFAPAVVASPDSSQDSGSCDAYDSWCTYCAAHPSADACLADDSGG